MASEPQSLDALLDNIEAMAEAGDPTIGDLIEAGGSRSLGPALLAPSIIAFSPIGAIPGMSIAMGVIIILFAAQLLFGRDQLWTPSLISKRTASADKVTKGVKKMRKPTAWLDERLGKRWTWASKGAGEWIVGLTACLLAVTMFPLAVVPFGVLAPSGALIMLSMGLMLRDGILIVFGEVLSLVTIGLLVI